MEALSIVIPTLNEAGNIPLLLKRLIRTLRGYDIPYELIFVDDHSTDQTRPMLEAASRRLPVRVLAKKGPRGKAYSLLQGFQAARYDLVCMIDADLQYPPEAIPGMYQQLRKTEADVVLTKREDRQTSWFRKLSSSVYNLLFTRLLFGFNYDTQSGLKLFRKRVIQTITVKPTPWSFDLEFIVRALEQGYVLTSLPIRFDERHAGEAKVKVGKVAFELAKASLQVWRNSSPDKVKRGYELSSSVRGGQNA